MLLRPITIAFASGLASSPGLAIPPPPPPEKSLTGAAVICEPTFAIALGNKETAQRYGVGLWVAQLAKGEVGVRPVDVTSKDTINWQVVTIPGYRSAARHRVFEFPDHRTRGWTYRLKMGDDPPVSIASDEFRGSKVDYLLQRRVLLGKARRAVC